MWSKLFPLVLCFVLLAGCTAEQQTPMPMPELELQAPDGLPEREIQGVNRTVSLDPDQYIEVGVARGDQNHTFLELDLNLRDEQTVVAFSPDRTEVIQKGKVDIRLYPGQGPATYAIWIDGDPPDEVKLVASGFTSVAVHDVLMEVGEEMDFIPVVQENHTFDVPERAFAMDFQGEETGMALQYEPPDRSVAGAIYPSTPRYYSPMAGTWTMTIWDGVEPTSVTPRYHVWDRA